MSTSGDAVLGSYQRLDSGATTILLDFSRVCYLNSSGIALVIQLLIAASKASQRVICFGLPPHFVKAFTMLGLTKYTSLYPNEAAARAGAG